MSAEGTYVRPWLAPYQEAAIFCPERYAVIEATTKSGKTVACIIWLLEQALRGESGWDYWWVAPVFDQAEIAYRRFKRYLPVRDDEGRPFESFKANESDLVITLIGGVRLSFKSGEKPDNLYGEDVHAAVIDEA